MFKEREKRKDDCCEGWMSISTKKFLRSEVVLSVPSNPSKRVLNERPCSSAGNNLSFVANMQTHTNRFFSIFFNHFLYYCYSIFFFYVAFKKTCGSLWFFDIYSWFDSCVKVIEVYIISCNYNIRELLKFNQRITKVHFNISRKIWIEKDKNTFLRNFINLKNIKRP